jgi:hypothetical protein
MTAQAPPLRQSRDTFGGPSFLQILHILIPLNTWYSRRNTQFITYIRRLTISAYHLNIYNCLHMLSTTSSITSVEHWPLLKVLPFIFKLFELINCIEYLLYCKYFVCVTIIYLYI